MLVIYCCNERVLKSRHPPDSCLSERYDIFSCIICKYNANFFYLHYTMQYHANLG